MVGQIERWAGELRFIGIMGTRGQWGAKAPFVSGQLLMNAPIMFIVPAEQFLGNACNSSFYKLTVMTICYLFLR